MFKFNPVKINSSLFKYPLADICKAIACNCVAIRFVFTVFVVYLYKCFRFIWYGSWLTFHPL